MMLLSVQKWVCVLALTSRIGYVYCWLWPAIKSP